jgi:hypothetical protein
VPSPREQRARLAERGARGVARVRAGSRASCFHSAITFSTMVTTRALDDLDQLRTWLKSRSSQPKTERSTMPTSSIT